jgi:hypothetical protein
MIASTAALATALVLSVTVMAAEPATKAKAPAPSVEIVKRGTDGRAAVVRIGGVDYVVCTALVQDSCINPRDAGLNWGARELSYWPGRPASEIVGPLPAKPAG